MKTKIVDETFDEKLGTTTVTIQNKYGHFTGVAYCHPDDEYSMFQGERIAATKASIEFLKSRIKQTKSEAKGIKTLLSDFYSNPNKHPSDYVGELWRHALIKLYNYQERIENYETSINILKNSIKLMDKERQEVLLRSKKNN